MSHHNHRCCIDLSKLFSFVPLFFENCQGCYLFSQVFPQKSSSYCSHMKIPFCPVFLLKLTLGQVNVFHLGFMETAHISVDPLHYYSKCQKYHGFHIEVILAFPLSESSLDCAWCVRSGHQAELPLSCMQGTCEVTGTCAAEASVCFDQYLEITLCAPVAIFMWVGHCL